MNEQNPFEILAQNIVLQAMDDYYTASRRRDEREIERLERFFRSEWYELLFEVDGELVIKKLRKDTANNRKNQKIKRKVIPR